MAKQVEWDGSQWVAGIPSFRVTLDQVGGSYVEVWHNRVWFAASRLFMRNQELTATTAESAKAEAIQLVKNRVVELAMALGMECK